MSNKKFKFVVVGGGSAGAIAATYLKKYWGDNVEVVLVYNHKIPNIGIGESLTPEIYHYLNYVGISREELIKNINATVKLGIKFKNWKNDNKEFYHSFFDSNLINYYNSNFESIYDLSSNQYNQGICYGKEFFENSRIPLDNNAIQSLHIDGVLFSQYVINKFKDVLTIIDNEIIDVVKKDNSEEIDHIICKDNLKIFGDFYIDASGLSKILFKHLENEWIDRTNELPLDSCIPSPLAIDYKTLPVCTTAEATDEGWILQVPLSSRLGTGYLFSSRFVSDEIAKEKFDNFLQNKFNTTLKNDKIIKFNSGYWKKQWVGNCIAIGLSSGFTEPLEATNIHHCVYQLKIFINMFNFKVMKFDVNQYNKMMSDFYERVYLFIRYCYTTNRTDSEFWKYMTHNAPESVKNLEEKIKNDPLHFDSMQPNIFNFHNFTQIAVGLDKINVEKYRDSMTNRNAVNYALNNSTFIKSVKNETYQTSLDHFNYVRSILQS
jgi:tryptophan halogenase